MQKHIISKTKSACYYGKITPNHGYKQPQTTIIIKSYPPIFKAIPITTTHKKTELLSVYNSPYIQQYLKQTSHALN